MATRCNILSNWVLARQVSLDYQRPAAKPFSCNSIQWESFCFFCEMHFCCQNQNFAWGILDLVFYCFNGVITLLICLIQKRQYLSKTKEKKKKKRKLHSLFWKAFQISNNVFFFSLALQDQWRHLPSSMKQRLSRCRLHKRHSDINNIQTWWYSGIIAYIANVNQAMREKISFFPMSTYSCRYVAQKYFDVRQDVHTANKTIELPYSVMSIGQVQTSDTTTY